MRSRNGSRGTTSAARASLTGRARRLPTLRCGVVPAVLAAVGSAVRERGEHGRRQRGERARRFGTQPDDAAAEAAHLAECRRRRVPSSSTGARRQRRWRRRRGCGTGTGRSRATASCARGCAGGERAGRRGRRAHEAPAARGPSGAPRTYHRRVEFVVARNPDTESSLPFLVQVPLGAEGITLKVRDVWPRTSKLYCHRADEWPTPPDVVERVGVRSCVRRGAAIDLVLDRGRENRSQFVFTKARGREVIFWQSARTARQARPNVTLPTARATAGVLEIVVDAHERYAWKFGHQQVATVRRALPVGDYAVVDDDGDVVAAVERKALADLVATVTNGKLRFAMAALAGAATCRRGRRGPLLVHLQAHPRPAERRRRRRGGVAGPLPDRADRVLRDSPARPGVGVPLPRRRRRAPPRRRGRRVARGAVARTGPRWSIREHTTS